MNGSDGIHRDLSGERHQQRLRRILDQDAMENAGERGDGAAQRLAIDSAVQTDPNADVKLGGWRDGDFGVAVKSVGNQ